MRLCTRFTAAVALAAALVACGGSENAGTSAPPRTPGPTSTAELRTRLLSAADLGVGWKAGERINDSDLAAFAQVPCGEGRVGSALARRLTAVTGAQFEPADRSYRHVIELVVTGTATQLDADLTRLFGAIRSCATEFAIPALGDQRAAYRVTQASRRAPTALDLRAAYVRVGPTAVLLGLADFQATKKGKSGISDENFVRLLRAAVSKLSG